jgi:hypothetical protein
VNEDPDPVLKMNANPCGSESRSSYVKKQKKSKANEMLNFNINKVT